MIKDARDLPKGILISMSLYAVYIHLASTLIQRYKIDNWLIFIIYFIPFIILYIGIPIVIRKSNG